MAILAGVVGPSVGASQLASELLDAQRPYSNDPAKIDGSDDTAFGALGAQSVVSQGRWLIVADARLDAPAELAGTLGVDISAPQANLLLAAWAKWEENSLERIYGDFALAVYDRDKRRLTLARDATGQRPLFYKIANGSVAFASLADPLRHLFRRSGPNLEALARHQANLLQLDQKTFFEDVERVMPGEMVHFRQSGVQRRLHWNPETRPHGTGEGYVESYRHLLDAAVATRISDASRPIGCHLSSGYDSSGVAGTAAKLVGQPENLVAFTAAPLLGTEASLIRHRFADESCFAAQAAQMHGIRHVIVRETAPLFDVIERTIDRLQSPAFNPFNMTWWMEIRRRARELGIDTMLTAEVGNLSLNSGGLRILSALAATGQWRRWWHEARHGVKREDIRWRGVFATSFQPWLPTPLWRRIRSSFLGIPPAADLSFLRDEWSRRLRTELDDHRSTGDPYRDRLALIRLNDLGAHRSAAAADGVDERDPMSDRRLIEFSLRLPYDQLLKDGQPRPLARAALSDRVPQSILDLHLRGMQGADWHLRISQQDARDVFENISACGTVTELLDLSKLRAAIESWPTGAWNSYPVFRKYRDGVTGALVTGLFLKRFDGTMSPRP